MANLPAAASFTGVGVTQAGFKTAMDDLRSFIANQIGTVDGSARFLAGAGSLASPTLSFSGDTDTGFYSFSANSIGISAGGVTVGKLTSSLVTIDTQIFGQRLSLGTSFVTGYSLRNNLTVTGNASSSAFSADGIIKNDVTALANAYISTLTTDAAAFNLTTLEHFSAAQPALGAGSTVGTIIGFSARSSIIPGTTNIGFKGDLPSGTGRWNFYASGLANNAYSGNSSFGKVTAPTCSVDATSIATGLVTNAAATYSWQTTDTTVIQTTAASTHTLPAAASFPNRILHVVTQFAGAVVSASSNVVPLAGGAAGTAILAATAGKYAKLQSNGTNWVIIEAN